jgi:hypothetical protein
MPKIKRKNGTEAENKKSIRKICASSCCKSLFHHCKATAIPTPSGLTYKIVKRTGIKPVDGSTYFHYAGYFEDLFDSSYEDVNKAYGTFDENRAAKRIPSFSFSGKKDGMIPVFGRIKSDVLWGQSGFIHSF